MRLVIRQQALRSVVLAVTLAGTVAAAITLSPESPTQEKTLDLSSIPAASEYATEAPKGRGFFGSESAVLGRSLARINNALGTSLQPDVRLARMAQWIYDRLGPEPSLPQQSELDLVTHHLGLPEPVPHLLITHAPDAPRLANVVSARLAKVFNLTEYTHIGGVADRVERGVMVIIALSRRHATMAPVPRSLPGPARLPLEGSLASGYSRPKLAHTLPGGETRIVDLGQGPAFAASADLAGTGRHRLEIVADGPRGPEVIVNFPVFVGVPAEVKPEIAPEPRRTVKPDQAQSRLFELINQERIKAGLEALVFDLELSEAARGHSEDMRKEGYVGHLSPTSGSAEERLLRAGIVTDLAAENIARGNDPDEIHKGLMDSPGHRNAILLPKTTHVGIGISSARNRDVVDYIVTELFIRRIPPLGPDAGLLVLTELAASRELDGLQPLKEEPALSELAAEAARRYLDDPVLSQDDVMDGLRRQLEQSQAPRGAVTAAFIVAGSIKEGVARMEIDPKSWAAARRAGIGIAQGVRPGLVPNSIVLVLIFSD